MTEPDKGSAKSFRYNSALENNIGKRTGNYIRRSGIGKDWDGLLNMNDYFDTNTDRLSVANTDELESSLTSDVFIDDSDIEKSPESTARSKNAKKKDHRKKKMMELSTQKSQGLFEDLMEPSQSQTANITTRTSRRSNYEDSLGIRPFSSKTKGKARNREDSSKDVSPDELRDQYLGNDITNLTKTPSISRSLIYEEESGEKPTQKELDSLMKQGNEFSAYLHELQEDPKLKNMRTQLKQIQDSRSQEFSLFQSPGALSGIMPSPQTRDMNFTTFSILDSTNKKEREHNKEANRDKELKGFRQPDLRESPIEQPKQESRAVKKGKENEEAVDTKQGKKKGEKEQKEKDKNKKNEDKKQEKKNKEEEKETKNEANKKDKRSLDSKPVEENKQETKKSARQPSPKIEEEKPRNNKKAEDSASSLNIKPLTRQKEETKRRVSRSFEEEEVYQRENNTTHFEYKESVHYEDNYQDFGYQDQGVDDRYNNSRNSSARKSSPDKKEKKVVQSKKGAKKDKKDEENIEHKTKKVKKNQTKEPSGKITIPKSEITHKKEPIDNKRLKTEAAKNTKKRKRDKFLEAYDRVIGPNDIHLVEKPIAKSKESFANGRYPRRHRVTTHCFWKNERSIYMNTGDGIEIVGIMREEKSPEDEDTQPKRSKSKAQIKKQIGKSSKGKKSVKSSLDLKGKNKDTDEDSEIEQEIEALDKMHLDYKVISEDSHAITVFLKLKPKQIKEPQTNVAGVMQCSVIKCEDRKVEVLSGQKQYTLSLNDKFVIPAREVYSIHNKSKTKDLEISCNILKGK